MKNYTKPTANVVELAVKESLSALPGNLTKMQKVATINANRITFFNLELSGNEAINPSNNG